MKQPVILIVEDESDIVALYKSILGREFDFEIVEADSIKSAQNMLIEYIPDYVLLDLCLKDGNGFDLIPSIQKRNSDVKILVISAFNHCKEKQKATELGAIGLLAKPFEKETFLQQLKMMHNLV